MGWTKHDDAVGVIMLCHARLYRQLLRSTTTDSDERIRTIPQIVDSYISCCHKLDSGTWVNSKLIADAFAKVQSRFPTIKLLRR